MREQKMVRCVVGCIRLMPWLVRVVSNGSVCADSAVRETTPREWREASGLRNPRVTSVHNVIARCQRASLRSAQRITSFNMVSIPQRMRKLQTKLLAIRLGSGALILPKNVTRIHMRFAQKIEGGHAGPR